MAQQYHCRGFMASYNASGLDYWPLPFDAIRHYNKYIKKQKYLPSGHTKTLESTVILYDIYTWNKSSFYPVSSISDKEAPAAAPNEQGFLMKFGTGLTSTADPSSFKFGLVPSNTPPPSQEEPSTLVVKPSNDWNCQDCYAPNPSSQKKCLCCEAPNPACPSTES